MMKPFRKSKRLLNSLGSSKHSILRVTSSQLNNEELSSVLNTPQKVIKALYNYVPQGPGELKFEKGDFFHVVEEQGSGHEANGWYEATNPATQQRGMVPISYFEVFNKNKHNSGNVGHSIEQGNPLQAKLQNLGGAKPATQTLYAVTLFDFKAERDDELDIVTGENLVICAHHEFEWFIAKPITRLGGPGLVPVLYVKIIDLMGLGDGINDDNPQNIIKHYKIPTVEEWKDQTAKYEALTIRLGHIFNTAPAVSSNSHFFQKDGESSNRSSLSSTKTFVAEAAVDSYHLENGRYQYLVVARLSNGKTRYLHRFYQDFYDLQVKLLELFPYEAGKIENSRRIIPSIPGPLINVNDSISKLRREKLDYYLRNLVALPTHISRSEEVLTLFEVLDNGSDKEVVEDRSSKPVMRRSNYQQDRLSEYSLQQLNVQRLSLTPSGDLQLQRSGSNSSTHLLSSQTAAPPVETSPPEGEKPSSTKAKVKFYFEDDIFVLLLPINLHLQDLKSKLSKRLNLDGEDADSEVHLFLKNDYDEFMDSHHIATDVLLPEQREQLFQLVIDDDEKFQGILYDKCKVVILTG